MATPDRIRVCIRAGKEDWIGVAYAAETDDPSTIHEYVREDRKYFCSCGGALTAEEYITHYFEMGHDHGIGVKPPASAAPVVDDDRLARTLQAEAELAAEHPHDGYDCGGTCAFHNPALRFPAAAATAAPVEQSDDEGVEHCGCCKQDYNFLTQRIACPHGDRPRPLRIKP